MKMEKVIGYIKACKEECIKEVIIFLSNERIPVAKTSQHSINEIQYNIFSQKLGINLPNKIPIGLTKEKYREAEKLLEIMV
jgi:hypothetical protein